jgi:hypothetical protein
VKARTLLSAIALLAIVTTACHRDADETAAGTSPAATVSPSPSATEASASPMPSPTQASTAELEDGRHFGYIDAIDPTVPEIIFDLAYLLSGDDANEAAAEHGDEVPVPNDYYIVNDNPRLRTLALAPTVRIFVLDRFGPDVVRGDLDGFVEGFETNDYEGQYHGSAGSYWVVVRDGLVARIEEQYFP